MNEVQTPVAKASMNNKVNGENHKYSLSLSIYIYTTIYIYMCKMYIHTQTPNI